MFNWDSLTKLLSRAHTWTGIQTFVSAVFNTGVSGTAIDTDSALTANSDTLLASQKAVKAHVAAQIAAIPDPLLYKGVIDCSASPNYPAADAGNVYVVSVAGLIGGGSGISVVAGDFLLCKVDGSLAGTQAAVGANWDILEKNIDLSDVTITGGTITGITDLVVADGGTGASSFTDGGLLVGDAANPIQALAAGATTEILVGGGVGVNPVWTTATGTGAPVRATNPTLAGQVVNTTLPAFFAYNSATDADVTGDGTTFTVIFDTEVFDQGANFDGTSTFTAPVTGKYRLSAAVQLVGMTTTHIYFIIRLVTSNRTYVGANPQFTSVSTVATMPLALNILADMDAGDTATVTVLVPDSTKVVDVQGDSAMQTRFCGELVC